MGTQAMQATQDKSELKLKRAGLAISIILILIADLISSLYIYYSNLIFVGKWGILCVISFLSDVLFLPIVFSLIVLVLHNILHRSCPSKVTYAVGLKLLMLCNIKFE
jgi:hypothetical protein